LLIRARVQNMIYIYMYFLNYYRVLSDRRVILDLKVTMIPDVIRFVRRLLSTIFLHYHLALQKTGLLLLLLGSDVVAVHEVVGLILPHVAHLRRNVDIHC
jgi:hypothetical protein